MIELLLISLLAVCDPETGVCTPDAEPAVATSHVANPTVTGPYRSIVVKRVYLLPRVRDAKPARRLAGAVVQGTSKILKVGARAAKVALPPYPRVRQRLAGRFCN